VVAAPAVPEVAVGVLVVLVPGLDPVPYEGVLRLLVLVPVVGPRGGGLDAEIADPPGGHRTAVVVHHHRLVPRHHLAGGARPGSAPPGREGNKLDVVWVRCRSASLY